MEKKSKKMEELTAPQLKVDGKKLGHIIIRGTMTPDEKRTCMELWNKDSGYKFISEGQEVDDVREADYALFSTAMTREEWEEKYGNVDIVYGTSDKEEKERVAKLKKHDYGKKDRTKH